ncbi:HAD family hydrolase [Viridibacterium curvum]|uniref:HAD family hydrolase n=1 Tax=Viridibacterium curvum TaxID=1101404 RepID=A0ABP9QIM6_9RHOO
MRGAVLFDLDETLIDRRAGLVRFARQIWQEGLAQGVVEEAFVQDFLAIDNLGATSRRALFEQLSARYMPHADVAALVERFLSQAWVAPTLFPDALDTLHTLEARGWKIGIVSNGSSRTQRDKINRTALSQWADVAVISEEFGSKKPEPAIYLHALKKLGVPVEQAWFVGDCAVNDAVGATRAGLRAIWLERHGQWPAQYEPCYVARVTSLAEVLDVIA